MALFNTNKCDVPYIPDYDFNFVDDCVVLPAPPPIFDCPLVDIPYETPIPEFDLSIPCPILTIDAAGSVAFHDDACTDPTFDVISTLEHSQEGNSCRLDLNLDLALKIPQPRVRCPAFETAGNITLLTGRDAIDAEPEIDIVVTNTTTDNECNPNRNCTYAIDFYLTIPVPPPACPVLTSTGSEVTVRTYHRSQTAVAGDSLSSSSIPASTVDVVITPYDLGTDSEPLCGIAMDFMFNLAIPVPEFDQSAFNLQISAFTGYIAYGSTDELPLLAMVRYGSVNRSVTPCCDDCDTPGIVMTFLSAANTNAPVCVIASGAQTEPISTLTINYKVWYMGMCCARVRGPVSMYDKLKPDTQHRGVRDTSGLSNVTALGAVASGVVAIIPVLLGGPIQSMCAKKYQLFVLNGPTGGTFVLPVTAAARHPTTGLHTGTATTINVTVPYNATVTQVKDLIESHDDIDVNEISVTGAGTLVSSPHTIIMPDGTSLGNGGSVTISAANLTRSGFDVPRVYISECCS